MFALPQVIRSSALFNQPPITAPTASSSVALSACLPRSLPLSVHLSTKVRRQWMQRQAAKKAPPPYAQQAEPSSPNATAVPGVETSGGAGDDEQVERFYALLDNIRAMRAMFRSGGGTATGRKRAREAELPWRPAFRMEDFELEEVTVDAGCAGKKKKKEEEEKRKGLARRQPAGSETAAVTGDDEGEVVVRNGPGRISSRGAARAGALTS
ncbi:NRR repressor homolog 2-like [Phragmites australis]|uniref:NRR repressor homolog 2-like n=1 Tax=Phragmites australis TaxID=29695 RepID=UPI002D773ADC|nr:NRR repressor homolog 2-like [Phragmites australis]